MPPRHIVSHTGLRGIAALLVVFYHLQFGPGPRFAFETATLFFRRGYLWVDLFFVLSGFIISYTAGAGRTKPFSPAEAGRFLGARIARVYPLHLFTLGVLLLFAVLLQIGGTLIGHALAPDPWRPESMKALLLALPLLHAWDFGQIEAWNIPSWSISAEMFAYLLFPLIVTLHALAPRATRGALLILAIAFYVVVAATGGSLDIVMGWAPIRCLAGFSLGMLLFYWREPIGRIGGGMLAILQIGAAAVIVAGLALPWPDVTLVPAFVLMVATTWRDKGPLMPLLTARPARFLGEISYSIYMNHVCLIVILGFFWARIAARLDAPPLLLRFVWMLLLLGATLIVSTLTYRYVEKPARKWLSKRLIGRTPRLPTAVPTAP